MRRMPRSAVRGMALAVLVLGACTSDGNGTPEPDGTSGLDGSGCPARVSGQAQDKVELYVPAENEVPGWVEDTGVGPPGVAAGYTYDEIVALIDGSHEPYALAGCAGFAMQEYRQGTRSLQLSLWEMQDSAAARKMFAHNRDGLSSEGIAGEAIACVYDDAVIGNDRLMWKAYAQKSQYILKLVGQCSSSSEVATLRGETIAFLTALTEKLP